MASMEGAGDHDERPSARRRRPAADGSGRWGHRDMAEAKILNMPAAAALVRHFFVLRARTGVDSSTHTHFSEATPSPGDITT